MAPKIKQKKPNQEESDSCSSNSDSSDENAEAYTGNEVNTNSTKEKQKCFKQISNSYDIECIDR